MAASPSASRRSGEPGPSRCCWPTISSTVRGRSRTASGAPADGVLSEPPPWSPDGVSSLPNRSSTAPSVGGASDVFASICPDDETGDVLGGLQMGLGSLLRAKVAGDDAAERAALALSKAGRRAEATDLAKRMSDLGRRDAALAKLAKGEDK